MRGPNGKGNGVEEAIPVRRGPGRPRKVVNEALEALETEAAPMKPALKGPRGRASTPVVIDVSKLMVKPKTLKLTIIGTSPLIVHNFGAKAIKMILDKQIGAAKPARAKKVPFDDFKESLYILNDKKVSKLPKLESGDSWKFMPECFGFPASGFKKAMVAACGFVDGVPKSKIRGLVHIHGNWLPIRYKKLVMRQDTVRVGPFGRKVADVRFRGEFQDWEIDLTVSYNENVLKADVIAMLLNNAGFSIGIGEWRPEKDGSFGTFAIK